MKSQLVLSGLTLLVSLFAAISAGPQRAPVATLTSPLIPKNVTGIKSSDVDIVEEKPKIVTPLTTALTSKNFTRLVDDLNKFDLVNDVSKSGPITVFAPSNDAFRTLMIENRQTANNADLMKAMIRRSFVVNKKIMPSEISNEMIVESISGDKLRFNIYGKKITVNGVVMTKDPVLVNGDMVIYSIDNLMMSSFTSGKNLIAMLEANKDRFSTLIRSIQAAGLTDTLKKDGPFTLFAPTNAAFKTLTNDALARLNGSPAEMKRVLQGNIAKGTYFLNVLDGTNTTMTTLDGSTRKALITSRLNIKVSGTSVVTAADNIMAENGVIHAMARVMMP